MKTVVKYQTFDGELHDNASDAKRHLDKIYGNEIHKIARPLVHAKYSEVLDFIDSHLEDFVHLKRIKDDFLLIKDDDE